MKILWPILALAACLGPVAAQAPAPASLVERLLSAPGEQAARQVLDTAPGEVNEGLFAACRKSAQARLDRRQHPEALREFQAALAVAERLKSSDDTGIAWRGVGLAYWRMEQATLAATSYRKGYEAAAQAGDKPLMAELLRGLGVANRAMGRTSEAIADDERSIALYRELKDEHLTAAGLNNLGANYRMMGDLRRAAEYYQEALRLGASYRDVADSATSNLGVLSAQQGNFSVARSYLEQMAQAAEQRQDYHGAALSLANLAPVYRSMGDTAKALATCDRGVALAAKSGDIGLESAALINRAAVQADRKRPDLAIADLKESLRIQQQGDSPRHIAYGLTPLARLQNQAGQTGEALAEVERAIAIGHEFRDHEILWQALLVLAECEMKLNDRAKAREAFEESIQEIETLRDMAGGGEQEGQSFLAGKIESYTGLVGVLLDQGDPGRALEAAERARARQLLDVVRSGKTEPNASMTQAEQQEERRIGVELARLDRQIAEQRDAGARAAAQKNWERARTELESFRAHLYASHPQLAARRGDASPITLAETADLLPDGHTALVEFVVLQNAVYLFTITRGPDGKPAMKTTTLPWAREDLTRQVNAFREELAVRDLGYRKTAAALYRRLLGPIAAELRGKDTLALALDGPLWNLPFQALIRPDGTHLLERQAVFYTPSLTFLRQARRRHPDSGGPKQLLALGNPAGANLPNAAREVQALARLYGAAGTLALTGELAVKETWMREAPDYRVLHLATHGILNASNPMYSWLMLAPESGGKDDILEARDIVKMNLRADLAVLSACDTGRGEVKAGEGLAGMSWAFLAAGTATTVVSQWEVESAGTTELMVAFHRFLKPLLDAHDAAGRARSLQRAELALMRLPQYRHPFYWAGFVMIGDGY